MRRLWPLGALYLLAVLCMAIWGATHARSAEMCASGEDPVFCALKEQRNNAMDEAVIAEGRRRLAEKAEKATAEYWKQYVAGTDQLADWWAAWNAGLQEKAHARK